MLPTGLAKLKRDYGKPTGWLTLDLFMNHKSYYQVIIHILNYRCNNFCISSFHYIKHDWDPELTNNDYYKIEDDCLSVIESGNASLNAYIKGVIDKGIHSWKFKVEHMVKDTYSYIDFVIGVVDQYHTLNYPVQFQETWFSGSNAQIYPYSSYAVRLKQDDIIEMIINIEDKSLKYIINDKDFGNAGTKSG